MLNKEKEKRECVNTPWRVPVYLWEAAVAAGGRARSGRVSVHQSAAENYSSFFLSSPG